MNRENKEIFMSNVKKIDNGCWIWTGPKNKEGMGIFSYRNDIKFFRGKSRDVTEKADKCIYEALNRRLYMDHFLYHNCKEPLCVNPDHMTKKIVEGSKIIRGSKSKNTHLTEEDVKKIRSLHDNKKETQAELSRMFKVSRATIALIVKRRTWRHVDDE